MTFLGFAAVAFKFSKNIADVGPPLMTPLLMIVVPPSIGWIAAEDGPTPLAVTEAP